LWQEGGYNAEKGISLGVQRGNELGNKTFDGVRKGGITYQDAERGRGRTKYLRQKRG